jgi:glycosyltransferase involved in cell wall biosynthesis
MNICIITSSFPSHPDDVVQAPFLIHFIEGLKKRGHRVFLFTQDRKGLKKEFLEGVQIKWFHWIKSNRPIAQLNPVNPLDFLRIWNLFYKGKKALPPFLIENEIDACLGLWVLPGGFFANYAYRRTGVPYSVWALGSDIYKFGENPLLYPLMKRIIHEAKGVFADGFDLAKRVEERFKRKCFFLATTRTISPPPPLAKEVSRGLTNKPHRFLYVGRLEKVKGIDLLLHSMALLKEENSNIHLTIVGSGGMEGWATNFINQKGLGKSISMMGNIPDETLASLYASSDCVVIPSRSESIPLVFSEALKFNKELIVTDVGDMGMLGRQYEVAWVVPSEDVRALKEMMKKRVKSRYQEKKERDGAKGEELKRLFDMETSVERFLADYEKSDKIS